MTFRYDHRNRQVSRSVPNPDVPVTDLSATKSYYGDSGTDPDTTGRLKATTDYNGDTTIYEYDSWGRLQYRKHYVGAATLGDSGHERIYTYIYDANGRLMQVNKDADSLVAALQWVYVHDAQGRLVTAESNQGYLAYEYETKSGRLKNRNIFHDFTDFNATPRNRRQAASPTHRMRPPLLIFAICEERSLWLPFFLRQGR